MKNAIILFLFFGLFSFGQEPTSTITVNSNSDKISSKIFGRKNEIKLDLVYLIFRPALNLSYERLLTDETGLGATVVVASDDTERVSNTTFSFTPYFRYFFGKKPSSGFFFEGFTAINTFKFNGTYKELYYDSNNYSYYKNENKKVTDLAVGVGLGGKWITKGGIVFELNTGVGRNLFYNYSDFLYFDSVYRYFVRGGISVGYRF